jgi:hypothetical protein
VGKNLGFFHFRIIFISLSSDQIRQQMKDKKRKTYDNGFGEYYYQCGHCGSESVNQVNDGTFSPPKLICGSCDKTVINTPIKLERNVTSEDSHVGKKIKLQPGNVNFNKMTFEEAKV